jgi:hypothetical protein
LVLPASDLFSCFAGEMLFVALGISAGLVNDTIPMVGRGVEGIRLHRHSAGVDDVVIDPGRNEYRKASLNRGPSTIFLNTEELVNLVKIGVDVFLRFQRHQDKLRVIGRV